MKKIKATITINMGLYMDIRPEVEIEVPENLSGPELVQWLHKEYHGILDAHSCQQCGGVQKYGGEPYVNGLCEQCRKQKFYQVKK